MGSADIPSLLLPWCPLSGHTIEAARLLQECRGHAPRYAEDARLILRGILTACRHVVAETCGPMAGGSDGKDLLPEMLRGSRDGSSLLRHGPQDLSGFHVAVLWVGGSIAVVGELFYEA